MPRSRAGPRTRAAGSSAAPLTGADRLWPPLGRAFASLADSPNAPADVIATVRRVPRDRTLPARRPGAADLRTEPEAIARVRDRAAALSNKLHGGARGTASLGMPLIGVVLVADTNSAAKLSGQVNDMLVHAQTGARVVGTIADDPAGADQLAGRRRGRLEKSLLIRSARKVTSDLYQQFGAAWSMPTGPAGHAGHSGPGAAGPTGPAGTGMSGHAGAGR
ncbi:hypothetical protein SVIOM342S_02932 [Streptomyces violaceorubidus]